MDTQALAGVGQKKPYITMTTIAKYRSKFVSTQKGKAARNVNTVFAFEREDGIVFHCSYGYRSSASDAPEYSDNFHYKFAVRKNKKGEKRFIFYRINRNAWNNTTTVRTSNPNQMRGRMESAALQSYRNNKKVRGIPKAQIKRLLKFVHAFLDKHGILYKGLSKDPFSLMYQLCYPGSAVFDSLTLQQLQCSKFLLRDPVREVLRTKGKMSKKLVFAAIKNKPRAINTALTLARYLRINRSLDHAQQFLKLFSEENRHFYDISVPHDNFSITKLKAKQLKVLDRLSVEELIEVAKEYNMLQDTFSMMEQLGGNAGFNVNEIQYRTLRELHDHLSQMVPGRGHSRGYLEEFKHYEFDANSAPMKFCALLESKLDKYKVSFAKNTEELKKHSEKMHNCSFFYHPRIAQGNYAIFCIDDRYMFGVIFYKGSVTLDQAVTFCNGGIQADVYTDLNNRIENALKGEYYYGFREGNNPW